MEFKNKVEVKFPGIEGCILIANADCPLGKVYDFACALRSYAVQKMQEEDPKPQSETPKEEIPNQ